MKTLEKYSFVLALALALVSIIPILLVQVPAMSDLASHIARYHILLTAGRNDGLDPFMFVTWRWTGNLGVDLLVLAASHIMDVEAATRLALALIVFLSVFGLFALSRAAHGRLAASALLALPFVFGQPFYYGFVNYCLSLALMLFVAAAWLQKPPEKPLAAIGFGVAALIVWTCHVMGWAILLILIGGMELTRLKRPRDVWRRALLLLPLLSPLLPMLAWQGKSPAPLFRMSPGVITNKFMNFVTMLKGLSRWFDVTMTLGILALAAVAFLLAPGGRRMAPRLAVGAGLLLVLALVMPTNVMGSWGADLRLTPVAVMLLILAVGPARSPKWEAILMAAGLAIFLARVGWMTHVWLQSDAIMGKRLDILDQAQPGTRFGYFSVQTGCRTPWQMSPDGRLGAYAITRRDAFSNTLFQVPGADLIQLRRARDRSHWFEGSQYIFPICPGGQPDLDKLATEMSAMSRDGFDRIWIAGLPQAMIRPPTGYRAVFSSETDTLLARKDAR